jgi:GH25 family lysozyme M1 (1,4-beta-N-acetylmuramidase)
MLFSLKALAPALLLPTAFGLAIEAPGHFEINAQPKGIDVSSHQGNVNWTAVVAGGVSFAYIKATEGTSKGRWRVRRAER